ncbi:MAG: hypothetical protein JW709_05280 [Sedimentisphaerales bacterium]|nr:hypothetical protein [Sedimentisphaerales bacterium]
MSAGGLADAPSPYIIDADTLHLYHFDGNGCDEVSHWIDLSLYSGATMDLSAVGFDLALNTYDGATGDGPYAAAVGNPMAVSNFVGADGAFTFEAIIKPMMALNSLPNHMQIISGDGDNSTRGWHFRIGTDGKLRFTKLAGGTEDTFNQAIPTSGAHAYAVDSWFHAAVTYNGLENTDNNLKLYWTRLNSGVTEAQLLGSFKMTADLNPAVITNFCIGNEQRVIGGFSENFEGLIDEARISGMARASDEMLFKLNPQQPVFIIYPADQVIEESETAIFEVVFTSATTPQTSWYRQAEPDDIELLTSDPNVTMTQIYDPGIGRYTATLILEDVEVLQSGIYYAYVDNAAGQPAASDTAILCVEGLWAHWMLDLADYNGMYYEDIIGNRDALVEGSVIFVTGANGAENGAVHIQADSGWAQLEQINPAEYTGEFTLSYWANWQEETLPYDDFLMTSDNGESVLIEDGLTANDRWQHICAVFDGNTAKLYLDGVLQSETAWPLPSDAAAGLTIGRSEAGQESFNGYMDDVRIYNDALDDYQVADVRYDFNGLRSCIRTYRENCDWTGPEGAPDCIVNFCDVAVFASAYLGSDTQYDLTGPSGLPDGVVDLYDLVEVIFAWLDNGLYPDFP